MHMPIKTDNPDNRKIQELEGIRETFIPTQNDNKSLYFFETDDNL